MTMKRLISSQAIYSIKNGHNHVKVQCEDTNTDLRILMSIASILSHPRLEN